MIRHIKIIVVTCLTIVVTTCKKYDEGGLEFRTVTKLLGGNKPGCSKDWHLKKYIVDGIDSTNLIQGYSNNEPIIFKYHKKDGLVVFIVTTSIYNYTGRISYHEINTDRKPNAVDSTQCSGPDCQRNIFRPELKNVSIDWRIKKLTKKEMILESNFISNHNYRIILIH